MITTNFRLGKLYNADCLDMLRKLKADSIDLMASDPPFGISFMGKVWDKAVPSVEIWQECLRVLKPGAFAFIFSLPRQDVLSRMIVNLEDAGFDCSFTSLYWAYASGFPKASNVSKMIDKKAGAEGEVIGVKRSGIKEGPFGSVDESEKWINQTAPATDKAKEFDGAYAGFSPKPAVEIILTCMKPMDHKTYIDQALDNGKGVSWLGDGRIPADWDHDENNRGWQGCEGKGTNQVNKLGFKNKQSSRFPANLLVSDNVLVTGEVKAVSGRHSPKKRAGKEYHFTRNELPEDNYSSHFDSGDFSRYFSLDSWFAEHIKDLAPKVRQALPFIILPKPSKGEKNEGCDGLEGNYHDTGARTFDDVCASCGKKLYGDLPYRCNCEEKITEKRITKGNSHPTVKGIQIFNYLITIGSRPGDTILDPFLGSGTAALSASMLNRRWVGAEISEEYCEIIRARLDHLEATETPDLF